MACASFSVSHLKAMGHDGCLFPPGRNGLERKGDRRGKGIKDTGKKEESKNELAL
jgi:hypothetical protein